VRRIYYRVKVTRDDVEGDWERWRIEDRKGDRIHYKGKEDQTMHKRLKERKTELVKNGGNDEGGREG
jgi:hypothetical protein